MLAVVLVGAAVVHQPATSANSGELTRELRGAPVWRVAAPGFPMPHSYSIFLVNNKTKVQMGVSSALFLFL